MADNWRAELSQQYREQKRAIVAQSETQRRAIINAVNNARVELKSQLSDLERESEAAINAIRKAEALEQRKRDLPLTKPTDIKAKSRIADINKQRADIKAGIDNAKTAIQQAESKDLAAVEKAVSDAINDLQSARDKIARENERAEADYNKLVTEYNTALKTGKLSTTTTTAVGNGQDDTIILSYKNKSTGEHDVVSRTEYNKLTLGQQTELSLIGVDAFNKAQQKIYDDFLQNNIRLSTGEYVDKKYYNELDKSKQALLMGEGVAHFNQLESYRPKAKNTSLTSMIWQAVTPWDESADVTFTDFITGYNITHQPVVKSQDELKAIYEQERSAPLWSKILFGTTVVKDNDSGQYMEVIALEAPAISPASGGQSAVKGLKTVIPKVAESAYTRSQMDALEQALKEAIQAKTVKSVNWDELAKAIRAGQVNNATSASRWVKAKSLVPSKEPLIPKKSDLLTIIKAAQEAKFAQAAKLPTVTKLTVAPLEVNANVPVSKWLPFNPSTLTVERANQILKEWSNMKASQAINQMLQSNGVVIAYATDAKQADKIMSKGSTSQQTQSLTQLMPEVRTQLKNNNLTKTQSEAQTQLQTQLQMQEMLDTATELATELAEQTETQTKTQVQEKIQTALQQQVNNLTKVDTQVKTNLRRAIEPISRTVSQQIKPVNPIKIKIPKPDIGGDNKHQLTASEKAGAVGWKQGIMYKYIYPPYGKYNIINSHTKIPGIPVYSGAKAAYRSIVRLGGKLPPTIKRDMGIMDISIITVNNKPRIEFTPDVKQRTNLSKTRKRSKSKHNYRGHSTSQLMSVR